jgi:cytochrome P450
MELRPFTGTYLTDPAATWRTLLDSPERVHYADDLGMWLISRYDDVRTVLGDSENFSNALTLAPVYQVCPEAMSVLTRIDAPPTTAAADAPTHPRTRRALRAVFANTTRRAKDEYGPLVARRVDQLLSRLAGRSGQVVDLVPEFTAELPLLVIVDILGAPEDEHSPCQAVGGWADSAGVGLSEPRGASASGTRAARVLALLPGTRRRSPPGRHARRRRRQPGAALPRQQRRCIDGRRGGQLRVQLAGRGARNDRRAARPQPLPGSLGSGQMGAHGPRSFDRAVVRRGDPAIRPTDRRVFRLGTVSIFASARRSPGWRPRLRWPGSRRQLSSYG